MRALNKDKSPGPDGITNRMLTGGGEVFTGLLHDFLSSLWLHEVQPRAWELSLMQPIYKGGNKLKTDPASYRGIYLSSALAKLFEGLLLHRLTQYTEAHDTLTPNQLPRLFHSLPERPQGPPSSITAPIQHSGKDVAPPLQPLPTRETASPAPRHCPSPNSPDPPRSARG